MSKTATLLRGINSAQNLYKMEPPLDCNEYVVSSYGRFTEETMLFPSDEQGRVFDYTELEGSFYGSYSHEEALRGAGYAVSVV